MGILKSIISIAWAFTECPGNLGNSFLGHWEWGSGCGTPEVRLG